MKNISVLALGLFIAFFGLTQIGAAADSPNNNISVSERLGSNSGGDSFYRVTYPRSAHSNAGEESNEDPKRTLERYKWIIPGNNEYDRKGGLNPLTLYNW